MNDRIKSLVKNTSILSFGTLCTKGIMFLVTPLFTRWLSLESYGTFDLLLTYVTLLVPLLTLASGEAIFRFLVNSGDEGYEGRILSTAFLVDCVGIVIGIIGGIAGVCYFKLDLTIVLAFECYLVMEIIYNYMMMAIRGEKKLNIYALGNVLYVLGLAVFVTIFVFVLQFGLAGILLGYAFGDVVAILFSCYLSKICHRIKLQNCSISSFKEIIRYSIPMIPNSISWWIVNVSDRTFISMFLGTEFNAIYAVANKIPALCTTFFSVFHLSWQQNATEALSDVDRDGYYNTVLNNMIKIVSSICSVILGINYWFFKLLFTENYFSGYYQVPVLVLAIIFSMMGQYIGGIYVAQMKSKKNGFTTAMAAVINIIVNVLLIKRIGLFAMSISTLIAYLALFIVRYIDIKRDIKLRINKESCVMVCIVLYFTITSYIPNFAFKVINLLLGFICFVVVNKDIINEFRK